MSRLRSTADVEDEQRVAEEHIALQNVNDLRLKRVSVRSNHLAAVMPALVAGIHVFLRCLRKQDVDGRDKPGHDSGEVVQYERNPPYLTACKW
jgi:hypothetical protein